MLRGATRARHQRRRRAPDISESRVGVHCAARGLRAVLPRRDRCRIGAPVASAQVRWGVGCS